MIRLASSIPKAGDRIGPLLRRAGIAVAAGVLLAALGPFGSYINGGPIQRIGYWIAATLLGLLLYGTAYRIVSASFASGSGKWWLALTGATLLASVPEAIATHIGAFWLWPELTHLRLPLALWFGQTATIGLVATLGMAFILRRAASTPAYSAAPLPSIQAEAPSLGRDVLALQMEDHYVRVHRLSGSELILMPLGHAIDRVETEGLRTHRSWWVASHAVAAVEGNARSMRLLLSNGLIAPVARSAVAHLKVAGWIADPDDNGGFRNPLAAGERILPRGR